MIRFGGFPAELFTFLTDLRAHNNRDWFNENKSRYEEFARNPTLAFIAEMKDRLDRLSPSFIADARPNGGSMFRIYRDTRFSRDKAPYKTNVGCQFRHSAGRDAHAPGFYVHIQSGESFAGGGIWRPPTQALGKIRDAIDGNQDEWARIREFMSSTKTLSLMDAERYKRPPHGVSADHPLLDDLKLKTFFAGRSFTDSEVASRRFVDMVEGCFSNLVPFMRFITEALGLSF